MEITTNKCIGCIYYTKINTYSTSPSTTRDDLVEKYGAYYSCSKPELVKCPRECGCISGKSSISITTRRCIICDNNCMDTICDECKEAIKKLKEQLKNGIN